MAAPTPMPPAPPSRPLGVAILAFLIGLFGFLWVLVGLLILAHQSFSAFTQYGLGSFGPVGGWAAGAIVLVIGLIVLGVAVGLWRLRFWALVLALLVLIAELVVYGIAQEFVSVGFLLSLILFVYLLAVHRHFH